MGIYDRDYVRREPPAAPGGPTGRGLMAMRMWSANTWLIIICVAVFMVDSLLSPQPVPMEIQPTIDNFAQIDSSALVYGKIQKPVMDSHNRPVYSKRSIYINTPQGRQKVAEQSIIYMQPIEKLMHFSTKRGFFEIQFWRLVGFQFLHANLMHLLFNMIGLFFFGPLVERFLGSKRYVAFYLLCGICGALMYVLLNVAGVAAVLAFGPDAQVPGLLFNSMYTPLIGASAGVFGVLMAGAYLAPNTMVLLFFFLPMRLKTLAYALVVLALITLLTGGSNAGGEAGHLGGAIAGFYFIRRPHHLHGFFDILGWADPTSHHYHHRRKARKKAGRPSEVDAVLDKVNREGLQSLNAREKRILREASEK